MSNTHEMQKQIDVLVMRLGSQGRVVIWTGAGHHQSKHGCCYRIGIKGQFDPKSVAQTQIIRG